MTIFIKNRPFFFSHILVFLGSFMTFYSAAQDCTVPNTLINSRILLEIDGQYTLLNPHAGHLQVFSFTRSTLSVTILETAETYSGPYQYQVLSPEVGLISSTIKQKETVFSDFNLVFICLEDGLGHYIYSQDKGVTKPDIRQNTGNFFIFSNE
ncbi:hypothetical protein [uncultured Shewanella sp.]|uniref:hypothetical protein n=1 Tax=uncultured Shewanella sp. TaxID=173975 RepID=UPI00262EC1EE|nr:hypothetical protein [uncultured Shewanella sp.]